MFEVKERFHYPPVTVITYEFRYVKELSFQ